MQNIKNEEKKEYVGSSFLEFLNITVRYRKFIVSFVSIMLLITLIITLLSDKWYESQTTVFESGNANMFGKLSGISSLVSKFSGSGGLSLGGGSEALDKFSVILSSYTVIDSVIAKYNYREIYDFTKKDYYEKVRKKFVSNCNIEIEDEGDLIFTFYDKDPKRGAEVANYMIQLANEINTKLSVREAKLNREFIEKRYNQNINDINDLEQRMKLFQEQYGVIEVEEQLKESIKAMAEIYSKLAEKEIEYNILVRMHGMDNPIVKNTKIQVEEISKKINKISAGTDPLQEGVNLIIPFKKAPELGNKYLKIYKNLEIQYKILEFITPLYEQAKVEEVKNLPTVTVLDKAVPAEKKAKPKISMYLLLVLVISLIISYTIVFILETKARFRALESEKYNYIAKTLQSDFRKITFRKPKP